MSVTPRRALVLFGIALLWTAGCSSPSDNPGNPKVPAGAKSSGGLHAVIDTSKGAFEIEFFAKEQPKAVENFRLLAEHGYYDGLPFHRIIKSFMIQGGDPKGDGTGGESAWGGEFPDDIDPSAAIYQQGYRRGILAMANHGPNTNGSQFFIMHQDFGLPPQYVIFAHVTKGLDVIDALAETPTTMGEDRQMSRPLSPPTIKTIRITP
jgi:cyclophilin family peptidyl-prolyl cis-trans isomerase